MTPIEDDVDRAIFLDPDEFGAVVLYGGVITINGLLLTASGLVDISQASPPAEHKSRRLIVRSIDVPTPAEGDTAVIGGVAYTVVPPIDDAGNGLVALTLEAAS